MRVVNQRTVTPRNELPGDGDDVTGRDGHSRRKVDVVDHLDPHPVLGYDREAFMPRMRPAADEESRRVGNRSGDCDVGHTVLRGGR